MELTDFIAIITLIPAIAWFVASFTKIYKLYQEHETEIKTKVKETSEGIKETAAHIKQKIEKKAHEKEQE